MRDGVNEEKTDGTTDCALISAGAAVANEGPGVAVREIALNRLAGFSLC